jgi:hypothetical protein
MTELDPAGTPNSDPWISQHRRGPRPATNRSIPHRQLDQWPPLSIYREFSERCLNLPYVGVREGRMATPGTLALYIADEAAQGPPEAFIDNHEFCHIHALPSGSLHMTLPDGNRERAILHGWAEEHPLVRSKAISRALVIVYPARDEEELELVYSLFLTSFHFARDLR